jgi:hypothetical protein
VATTDATINAALDFAQAATDTIRFSGDEDSAVLAEVNYRDRDIAITYGIVDATTGEFFLEGLSATDVTDLVLPDIARAPDQETALMFFRRGLISESEYVMQYGPLDALPVTG